MAPLSLRRLAPALLLVIGALASPAASQADVVTFGSSLAVPATKDTTTDLNYAGTQVLANYHVNHDGADTALWNPEQATGSSEVPNDGQILAVRQEGCAQPANGAPSPLTQIHYQDLARQPGGRFKVNVTTQPFDLPVCGVNGANASTVTTFQPENFCVHKGDFVAFNDEGGFEPSVPTAYPSGVPYAVIGSVSGSTMDSFIRNAGTLNGATFDPSDLTNHDGFAINRGSEVLMQMNLATGPDAVWLCPGGTRGAPHTPQRAAPAIPDGPPATVATHSAAVNRRGVVSVAVTCKGPQACSGTLSLSASSASSSRASGGPAALGSARFTIPANHTAKVHLHVAKRAIKLVRKSHGHLRVSVTIVSGPGGPANTATQALLLAGGHAG
jgi:hypothetical protein